VIKHEVAGIFGEPERGCQIMQRLECQTESFRLYCGIGRQNKLDGRKLQETFMTRHSRTRSSGMDTDPGYPVALAVHGKEGEELSEGPSHSSPQLHPFPFLFPYLVLTISQSFREADHLPKSNKELEVIECQKPSSIPQVPPVNQLDSSGTPCCLPLK
jgi:hypothetical protein